MVIQSDLCVYIKAQQFRENGIGVANRCEHKWPGVQSVENMNFTANFTLAAYTSLKTNALTPGFFELDFGGSSNAKATWEGQYDVYLNEGEVNGLIEMTVCVYPSTEVTIAALTTT